MKLQGEKVVLRPMTVEQVPVFYEWATQSDSTSFWYGELYGDCVPAYEEFVLDWKRYYFDGSKPEKGMCFVIFVGSEAVGQVNYNEINKKMNRLSWIQ